MKQLVIIPVYNEESTIKSVLLQIGLYYRGDILIVDDGSTDCSQRMALSAAAGESGVHMLVHTQNLGYGRSLIDGFGYALGHGYDSIVTIDCDAQHEPAHLPAFFEKVEHYDIVSGSRYLARNKIDHEPPPDRLSINKEITDLIRAKTSYPITDAFCGFKAYRAAALKKLSLDQEGYGFPLQLWIQADYFGLSLVEIPVERIYQNLNRSFGGLMDDPEQRIMYYKEVIEREVRRWT